MECACRQRQVNIIQNVLSFHHGFIPLIGILVCERVRLRDVSTFFQLCARAVLITVRSTCSVASKVAAAGTVT